MSLSIRLSYVALLFFISFLFAYTTQAATVTTDTVDTTTDPIILTGTSTESGSTITNVEYQTNGTGGSWTGCTATDGAFGSDAEGFSCDLGTLTDGDYTIYIRTSADTPLGFQATTTDVHAGYDAATKITSDTDNLYIAGNCYGCGPLGRYAWHIIAYSKSDGSLLWATTTDYTVGDDTAKSIVSDNTHVYVAGSCSGCGSVGGSAWKIVKYNKTDGSLVWSTTTDITVGDDTAMSIVSDNTHVYVAGSCSGCGSVGGSAWHIIAYSKSDGSFVWATTTDVTIGNDSPHAMSFDDLNLYVTGYCMDCGPLGSGAWHTIAYSKSDRSLLWSTTTDLADGFDEAYAITQDSNNVYIAGRCIGCVATGENSWHIRAHDKDDGSLVWSTTIDLGPGLDYANGVTLEDSNVYISGYCTDCGLLGSTAWHIRAHDKDDGSLVWSTTTDITTDWDSASDITSDTDNLFVTGTCEGCGSLGGKAFHTIAYDKATGNTYTSGTDTDNTAFTIDPPPSSSSQGTRIRRPQTTIEPIEITVGTPTIESLTERLNELRAMLAELLSTTGSGGSTNPYLVDLPHGSKHPDVSRLQQYLVSQGYLTMPVGVPYGFYGHLTEVAVAKLQEANNITPALGYFGPLTRGFLNQ